MEAWSDEQQDAFAEMLNIGVGVAASTLFELIGEEIKLSVPSIEHVSIEDLRAMLSEEMLGQATAVRQSFEGALEGDAILFFLEQSSAQLVRILLDPDLSSSEVAELEAEALSELGNIILNACMGAIANTLGHEVTVQLPVFSKGGAGAALRDSVDQGVGSSILIRIRLHSHPTGIGGLIVLAMNDEQQRRMRDLLDQFVAEAC